MSTAMLTTKGQVTIPKNVRDTMHIKMGDRIEFIRVSDDLYEIVAVTKDASLLKGIVKNNNKHAVSIDEMNSAISAMGQ